MPNPVNSLNQKLLWGPSWFQPAFISLLVTAVLLDYYSLYSYLILPERIWFCGIRKKVKTLLQFYWKIKVLQEHSGFYQVSPQWESGFLCLYHKSQQILWNKIGDPQLHVTSHSVLLINIAKNEDHVKSISQHHVQLLVIVSKQTIECLSWTDQRLF